MTKLIKGIFIFVFALQSIVCFPQGSTYSPYSYYGLGELEVSDHGITSGMSGVGIGIKSGDYINYTNPASYSGIDSLYFLFDAAITGNASTFTSSRDVFNTKNGGIKKLALGFRVQKWWAISMGLVPYSKVGYKINLEKGIEGTTQYFDIVCKGNGGLHKLYFGNSIKLNKHISFGFNTFLLMGSLQESETYSSDVFSDDFLVTIKYKPKSKLLFDFGVQLHDSINSKWQYNIGLTGGINTKLKMLVYSRAESDISYDSLDIYDGHYNFWIPAYAGFGFSLHSNKWLFAADYRFQNWDGVKNKSTEVYLPDSYLDYKHRTNNRYRTNSHHVAIGAEYCPNKWFGRTIFETTTYQVGAHYDRSYIVLNSKNIDSYGVTMGFILPLRGQLSNLGVSFELGKTGTMMRGLSKEHYFQVNLSLSMRDIWFQKRKFE